jgi:hypothetical protein
MLSFSYYSCAQSDHIPVKPKRSAYQDENIFTKRKCINLSKNKFLLLQNVKGLLC